MSDDRRRHPESEPARLTLSRLTPSLSGRPWGGGRFGTVDGQPVGELWVSGDAATLPDGRTLAEASLASGVPLVKILDIRGTLSVQVHPDDATARELRGPDAVGKHECWVVLEAPHGATVALGLRPGASPDDLFSGDERRIVAALRSYPVAAGSVLDIPPGTIHAPANGLLLYEIQQRSDLTFRVWDWGRPRPLHVEESRRALRPANAPSPTSLPESPGVALVSDPAAPFRLECCQLAGGTEPVEVGTDRPGVLSVIEGPLDVGAAGGVGRADVSLEAGSHWLLPPGGWVLAGRGRAFMATLSARGNR